MGGEIKGEYLCFTVSLLSACFWLLVGAALGHLSKPVWGPEGDGIGGWWGLTGCCGPGGKAVLVGDPDVDFLFVIYTRV